MPETSDSHSPEPPLVSVESLQRLIADLPPDWQLSLDGPAMVLVFNEHLDPQGYIDVERAQFVYVTADGTDEATD